MDTQASAGPSRANAVRISLIAGIIVTILSGVSAFLLTYEFSRTTTVPQAFNYIFELGLFDTVFAIGSYVCFIVAGIFTISNRHIEPFKTSKLSTLGGVFLCLSIIPLLFFTFFDQLLSRFTIVGGQNSVYFDVMLTNLFSTVSSIIFVTFGIFLVAKAIAKRNGRSILYGGFGILIFVGLLNITNFVYALVQIEQHASVSNALQFTATSLFPDFTTIGIFIRTLGLFLILIALLVAKSYIKEITTSPATTDKVERKLQNDVVFESDR